MRFRPRVAVPRALQSSGLLLLRTHRRFRFFERQTAVFEKGQVGRPTSDWVGPKRRHALSVSLLFLQEEDGRAGNMPRFGLAHSPRYRDGVAH